VGLHAIQHSLHAFLNAPDVLTLQRSFDELQVGFCDQILGINNEVCCKDMGLPKPVLLNRYLNELFATHHTTVVDLGTGRNLLGTVEGLWYLRTR
jgi:hypothetical protein